MQTIILGTKIHTRKQRNFLRLKDIIEKELDELEVTISSILFDENGYVKLSLEGEEEEVAVNYLRSMYGEVKALKEVKKGDTIKGYICDSGKVGFGVFVDIGIKEPYVIDALIPLYTLRKQLMDDKEFSARKIIELFGLINNVPVEVTIESVSIGLKKIEAKFSDEQLAIFNEWIQESLDRLYIIGAHEETVWRVLQDTRHDRDIIELEKLGWMESIITCKFNTNAKGLIPEIGRRIPKAKFEIFSPQQITRERGKK